MNEDLIKKLQKHLSGAYNTLTDDLEAAIQALMDFEARIHSCGEIGRKFKEENMKLCAENEALNAALENSGNRHIYEAPPGMMFVPIDAARNKGQQPSL